MVIKSLGLVSILLISVMAAFPQGRGGQGGRGGGGQGGSGGGVQAGQQTRGQDRGVGQTGIGQTEQKRIRLNTQQRAQVRTCDKLADGIRKQARTMARASGGKTTPEELGKQRNQIREQVQAMEQEHERLMNGIGPEQQQQWQEQIRNMNQYREQLNNRLRQIDGNLESANPDPKGVAERAREMEQIMKRWRNEYNSMSSQ